LRGSDPIGDVLTFRPVFVVGAFTIGVVRVTGIVHLEAIDTQTDVVAFRCIGGALEKVAALQDHNIERKCKGDKEDHKIHYEFLAGHDDDDRYDDDLSDSFATTWDALFGVVVESSTIDWLLALDLVERIL